MEYHLEPVLLPARGDHGVHGAGSKPGRVLTLVVTIGAALDGAPSLFSVAFDLASVGYAAHEHFATGTAESYAAAGPREPHGRWEVKEAESADYTTRLVVYRPTDPARSNGTLIVEWLNVTGGLDVPALWMPTHRHLVREGFTWVGVTAQRVGIEGGGVMPGMGLRDADPARYETLDHPGDAFAYDIFTQVARAARGLLSERYGIPIERVLATGASQSAMYLTTYVNAIDPRAAAVDGFLLQGRAGAGVPYEGWNVGNINSAARQERAARLAGRDQIRADARVPVMVVQSETDVFGALAYRPARQADSERFRLWEVAGASHCDTYFLCASAHDSGALPLDELAALVGRADSSGIPTERPINSGPQMHYVLQRAFDALDRWVRDGTSPPSAARLDVGADGSLGVDDIGIASGGVRTPCVDAPVAVLSGLGQPGAMTELFGTTQAFDDATRKARYPGGRAEYVAAFGAATTAAVDAGFILPADADEVTALGAVGWPES